MEGRYNLNNYEYFVRPHSGHYLSQKKSSYQPEFSGGREVRAEHEPGNVKAKIGHEDAKFEFFAT